MSRFAELHDIDVLQKLRDVYGLVRYYESADGEWAREKDARLKAREDFAELVSEASKRGLDWLECLQ